MPPTKRRTSSGPAAKSRSGSKQATLAFHGNTNKVTKPSATAPGKNKKELPLLEALSVQSDAEQDAPTTSELAVAEQAVSQAKAPRTPEEEEALQVSEARVKKYWREKENIRKVKRVHQEDLSLHEKVCREFDTDGRFGVCSVPQVVIEILC
jgi:DNA polymerase delta subunit 4